MRVSEYFTLESGSTTTTGLDIQSRTVLGMGSSSEIDIFAGMDICPARQYVYFTTNSTESIASNELSAALISCTSIRITAHDRICPSGMTVSNLPGAPRSAADTVIAP